MANGVESVTPGRCQQQAGRPGRALPGRALPGRSPWLLPCSLGRGSLDRGKLDSPARNQSTDGATAELPTGKRCVLCRALKTCRLDGSPAL